MLFKYRSFNTWFCSQVSGIEVYNVDIADWYKTRTAVEKIGPIDLLVNNAGITNWTSFLQVTKDELDKYVDENKEHE